MSTTITVPGTAELAVGTEQERTAGLFRRAFAAIMESRRLTAQRRIAAYLEGVSDEQLTGRGWAASEIASMRERTGQPSARSAA